MVADVVCAQVRWAQVRWAQVVVGIDPHQKTHTAVAVEAATGAQVGRPVTVRDDPDCVGKLLAWAQKTAGGRSVGWAIEDGRGMASRLAIGLVVAGQQAVWVPTRLMAGHHEARRGAARKGKSDPIDALAAARAALNADNAAYLGPVSLGEPGRDLGHLLDDRRDKIATRTRMINTLRWKLHQLGADLHPGSLTTLKGPLQLAERLTMLPAGVLRDLLIVTC